MRILYLDIDTLRPDHLPCYGYERPTAPVISQIAQEGVTFTECYTSDSPCVPSRAALISGRFGIHNGVVTHWGAGATFHVPTIDSDWDQVYRSDLPLFPRYLRERGMHSVTISSFADKHQAPWYTLGWGEVRQFTLKRGNEDAEEVVNCALDWLQGHAAEDNWFLHVHFWDPHKNYTMDPGWARPFAAWDPPAWPDAETLATHQDPAWGPGSAGDFWGWGDRRTSPVPTMPDAIRDVRDLKQLVDGYDGAIRYLDSQILRILEYLQAARILSDTAIIITSDHGESFGEHALYAQHADAGTAVHHVPMIVRWPGCGGGIASSRLIYQQDIVPTIVDLLGFPVPEGWDFQSFGDVIAPRARSQTYRDALVWGHGLYVCQRAVYWPPWFYIRTDHPGLFPWEKEQLYQVQADPHETRDRSRVNPEVLERLRSRLTAWERRMLPDGQDDPMEAVMRVGGPYRYVKPEPWLRHLRAMGQTEVADRITQRLLTLKDLPISQPTIRESMD